MSSYDGSRSARQSKRYSMSALYLSIANDGDLEIEDDLAKGLFAPAFLAILPVVSVHLPILCGA